MNYLNNNPIIIGIDHGYGNIKTAHTCFRTGVTAHDREPTFKNDLLIYEGRYYTIGEGHKEFAADKMMDGDYYILTLAAIGRELNIRKINSARIYLAAGLPLTWVSEQKDAFRAYLLHSDSVDFTFRGADYHVEFAGADVFPQGFAAVAANLRDFTGTNMLCDIGNGTMNVMYINERRPVADKCYTEKFGTHQCTTLQLSHSLGTLLFPLHTNFPNCIVLQRDLIPLIFDSTPPLSYNPAVHFFHKHILFQDYNNLQPLNGWDKRSMGK